MNNDKDNGRRAVGTGTGALEGAALSSIGVAATAGALAGGVTGPVGALIGAAVGAVAGAVMGNRAADPAVEESYWRENRSTRPYARKDMGFHDYQPAYRAGVESFNNNPTCSFDDVEPELGRVWSRARGNSSLNGSMRSPPHVTRGTA